MFLLTLFCLLILRLMRMGERQEEPFGRIYCYCVAAFLLFHLLVNVGMTIGLMPVMGIPLPLRKLRRLLVDRLYHHALHRRAARCLDPAILLPMINYIKY